MFWVICGSFWCVHVFGPFLPFWGFAGGSVFGSSGCFGCCGVFVFGGLPGWGCLTSQNAAAHDPKLCLPLGHPSPSQALPLRGEAAMCRTSRTNRQDLRCLPTQAPRTNQRRHLRLWLCARIDGFVVLHRSLAAQIGRRCSLTTLEQQIVKMLGDPSVQPDRARPV